MRVLIYKSDLLHNGAFKRTAKKIQLAWPGSGRLGLMEAQEILARGLGYRDCHDLQQSVMTARPSAGTGLSLPPSEPEVREGIRGFIFAHSKIEGASIAEVDTLLASLTLHHLQAYRNLKLQNMSVQTHETSAPLAVESGRQLIPHEAFKKHLDWQKRIFTEQQLASLRITVKGSASLKEQCMYELLAEGFRASEVVTAQVGSPVEICMSKGWQPRLLHVLLSQAQIDLLNKYIQEAGLKRGDYLFINTLDDRGQGIKMLTRMFQRWAREAGIERQPTVHDLRYSVALHRAQSS